MIERILRRFRKSIITPGRLLEQDTIETWCEVFGMKFKYKKIKAMLPPKSPNCRCMVNYDLQEE